LDGLVQFLTVWHICAQRNVWVYIDLDRIDTSEPDFPGWQIEMESSGDAVPSMRFRSIPIDSMDLHVGDDMYYKDTGTQLKVEEIDGNGNGTAIAIHCHDIDDCYESWPFDRSSISDFMLTEQRYKNLKSRQKKKKEKQSPVVERQ